MSTENVEESAQPSKKRSAGVELSRDNPYHNFEDENSDEENKTFKKASDEVLAARRILKVRRNKTTQVTNNPFAGITLVPSVQADSNNVETVANEEQSSAIEKTNDTTENVVADPETKPTETEAPEIEQSETNVKDEENQPEAPKPEAKICENEPEVTEKENNAVGKVEDPTSKDNEETAPLSTFGQLSSSQNAFTGFSGTGFSASSFSFAALSKDAISENGTQSNVDNVAFPAMQETIVETGEENETVALSRDGALFEFVEGKWKERGKGEVKINVADDGDKARLLMRARGNFRLILNANLYPEMKLAKMDKRGVSFACVNSAGDFKETLSTFALKFKDGSVVEDFTDAVGQQLAKLSK